LGAGSLHEVIMKVDKTLDIKGLSGQRSKEVTTGILGNMAKGQILRVITDDPLSRQVIPQLCLNLGSNLLSSREDRGINFFTIQK
jgi:TusA-related sulfurtransferase